MVEGEEVRAQLQDDVQLVLQHGSDPHLLHEAGEVLQQGPAADEEPRDRALHGIYSTPGNIIIG